MAKSEKGSAGKAVEKKSAPKKEVASAPAGKEASKEAEKAPDGTKIPPRLKEAYRRQVVPALMKELSYKNPMQVPWLERLVLNVGMGEAIQSVTVLESASTRPGVAAGARRVI